MIMKNRIDNKGISLIELIIVIAIMAILTGVLTPMFMKYIDKTKKAKDVYTADQIARAVNIAFVENPEAYEAFRNWNNASVLANVTATYNGENQAYQVYLVASNGTQDTNRISNCFNGGEIKFSKTNRGKDGSDGLYGVINRELGLGTTKINQEIIPNYPAKREGAGPKPGKPYEEVDRWRIVKRKDNGMMEIWVSQPNPSGGWPIYRLWPNPDDLYTN